MGNKVPAHNLIGMSVSDAMEFIRTNNVFFDDENGSQYRIHTLRIMSPDGIYTCDYDESRLSIRLSNGVINEIVEIG